VWGCGGGSQGGVRGSRVAVMGGLGGVGSCNGGSRGVPPRVCEGGPWRGREELLRSGTVLCHLATGTYRINV
jgi:hypothetical protein